MNAANGVSRTTGRRRFLLFVAVGGSAAIVNVVSRVGFNYVVRFEIAILLAYIVAMTFAYALNRAFVFAPSGRGLRDEYLRFALVNVFAAAQVWLISVGLARLLFPWIGFTWHAETVAHMAGVIAPVFSSYLGHKHISFSKDERGA